MAPVFRSFAMLCALLLTLVPARADEPLTIFAAASLREVLEEAAKGWEQPVVVSYGGSGAIARQVDQGAPADLVFLANALWMDWLASRGRIAKGLRRDLLGNRLVVIGPKGAAPLTNADETELLARLDGGRLALGQTQAVPAGIYARQWLENRGAWEALLPHLAETENVRAALALVARGEAPLGVVYASDAMADPGVAVLYAIDPQAHEPIVYPAAVVAGGEENAATAFLDHLVQPDAQALFLRHGFAMHEGGT